MIIFPRTPILDDFNRADENPIGGNWTNDAIGEGADNQLQIVSNQLQAVTAATSCEAYWNAQTFRGNIEAYFTVVTKPGDTQRFALSFFQNPGVALGWDGYQMAWRDNAGTDDIVVERVIDSIGTTIASRTLQFNAGDVLGFSMTADGKFNVWQNGDSVLSATDSILSGDFYLGVTIRDTVGVLDNFGGGNFGNSSIYANINGGTKIRPAPFRPGIAR